MDFSLSNTDFGQLRAFVAVAEALNYTRAAEGLGITNSALSRTVRLLEESVGVRLISRTTRSVSLTEAGDRLLQRVKPAIEELESAIAQTKRYKDRSVDVVRIYSSRSAADLFLRPILRSFSDSYSKVMLDITLEEETVDNVSAEYDVVIQIGEGVDHAMAAIKLSSDLRQIAVAAPDYLALHGSPNTPHDLAAHRCIAWRSPGQERARRWEFCDNGKWFDVAVDGPVVANSRELAVEAAIDGIGITFAIQEVVAPHIAKGQLVPLLEPWSAPFPGFYLCYPAQGHMTPTLRVLIDAVCSAAPKIAED